MNYVVIWYFRQFLYAVCYIYFLVLSFMAGFGTCELFPPITLNFLIIIALVLSDVRFKQVD